MIELLNALQTQQHNKKYGRRYNMKSEEKNNTDKALTGRGDLSEKAKIIRLATDYTDPAEVELDLSIDLYESFKKQYKEMVKEGYSGSFNDYMRSEIAMKNKYRAGGIVK